MGWVTFKIGKINEEKSLTFQVVSWDINHADIETSARNLAGDIRKTKFKVNVPSIKLTGAKMTLTDYNMLYSMKSRATVLNFLCRDDWAIVDEENASTDATHLTLLNTCATGITVTGVWLLTDPTHAGTNYFTGGSYNATTRVVTLGASLPGATTAVLVNYSYTGQAVTIDSMAIKAMQGIIKNYFFVDMTLAGA